jgi:hypothetical protein
LVGLVGWFGWLVGWLVWLVGWFGWLVGLVPSLQCVSLRIAIVNLKKKNLSWCPHPAAPKKDFFFKILAASCWVGWFGWLVGLVDWLFVLVGWFGWFGWLVGLDVLVGWFGCFGWGWLVGLVGLVGLV